MPKPMKTMESAAPGGLPGKRQYENGLVEAPFGQLEGSRERTLSEEDMAMIRRWKECAKPERRMA